MPARHTRATCAVAVVAMIRLAFVMFAWLFSGYVMVGLYLILDLVLQVHPEDRDKLLRFRINRWWRNRFARA